MACWNGSHVAWVREQGLRYKSLVPCVAVMDGAMITIYVALQPSPAEQRSLGPLLLSPCPPAIPRHQEAKIMCSLVLVRSQVIYTALVFPLCLEFSLIFNPLSCEDAISCQVL